ncbi:hypothetical protein [Microcystis phage Mvi-JY20]|uniref:Uncharacterized protein n=1 Tax=Microcystis phage Mvi-JY20 TaxID=3128146 RepID=A0AAX4QH55_9CAUD
MIRKIDNTAKAITRVANVQAAKVQDQQPRQRKLTPVVDYRLRSQR